MTTVVTAFPRRAWRSLLFVPGNNRRMLAGASKRGADAVVVDLEDSVPELEKTSARDGFEAMLAWTGADGSDLLVRINNVPGKRDADIRAAVKAGAKGIVVPKTEDAASLIDLSETIRIAEQDYGRAIGTCLVPLVETPRGLLRLREIAATGSVAAIALGDEDLALALGCPTDSTTLATFKHNLVVVAAEAGCQPLGLGCSIAEFGDIPTFRAGAMTARSWGMTGAFCIHPTQISILNEVFWPRPEEVVRAQNIVRLYEAATSAGLGAVAYDGAMIDRPIVERAYRVLETVTGADIEDIRKGSSS